MQNTRNTGTGGGMVDGFPQQESTSARQSIKKGIKYDEAVNGSREGSGRVNEWR